MKRVLWITADYFADCDLNHEIMEYVSKNFLIHWLVLEGKKPYLPRSSYNEIVSIPNLKLEFLKSNYRMRDPRSLLFYFQILCRINRIKPDVIYYNVAPTPASALISLFFDKNKTIFAAHDGKAQNDSSGFGRMRLFSYNTTFRHAKNIIMFSEAQAELMRKTYGHKNIKTTRLSLKNVGKVTAEKPTSFVRFLSFGHIIYQKNVDLLIEAGNIMYERGLRNFKISINGTCDNWDFYKDKIKYHEIFECNPHFISNEELLRLFAVSHYAVFPYRRVSQSGVLKLAFNYGLPVVVSNIGSFKEEIVEGENGFFFNAGSAIDLANVLESLLKSHNNCYSKICERLDSFVRDYYSSKKLAEAYIEFFNQITNS